ncbi:MAG: carbohydrate kinase family protein [Bacteroidales bacterium]
MERDIDILALGELNVDLILNDIKDFPAIGKEIIANDMLLTLGSSTAIFAANAASIGSKVAFMGMIGKDNFGSLVKSSLNAKNVHTSFLIESEKYSTGLTVVLSYDEDRANVTYPGAMNHMGINDIDVNALRRAKHVHISSLFMQDDLHRDIKEILELLKKNGLTISLDTQWDPNENWNFDYMHLLPLIDVFMPNEKELMALTKSSNLDDAIDQIKDVCNIAVIKCGSKGSKMITRNGDLISLPANLNSKVVDTVGAGDSFNAGFISAFVKGLPIEECQVTGTLIGAVSTTAAGGTGAFISKKHVEELSKEIFGKDLNI